MKKLLVPSFVLVLLLTCVLPVSAGEREADTVGRTVHVNDMQMYFEEMGQGEPLVLLHGHGGCSQDWKVFARPLAALYRVIMPDMRSHGRSTNPGGKFTHRQSATDLAALLDQLAITRFKAIGISSGGMTLLHLATQQPSRVDAMVLVGVAHYFPEQARLITGRAAEHGPTPGEIRYYEQCATHGEQQVRELAKQFSDFSISHDDVNFTAPLLGTIQARTLIVHGDRDEFFPVSIPVEMYAAIPDSALWIVPRGPHVPIFGTHAREFQDVAISFLQGATSQP